MVAMRAADSDPSVRTRDGATADRQPWRQTPCWLAAAALVLGFSPDAFRYTIGWPGYLVLVGLTIAAALAVLVHRRPALRLDHLPLALTAFAVWCGLSLLWSDYRWETTLGLLAQLGVVLVAVSLAVTLTPGTMLRVLGTTMRALVGASLGFELLVAVFAPDGVVPPSYLVPGTLSALLGLDHDPSPIPPNFYWSHGDLLEGGPIQGLMGNRNLLAMVALIALLVTFAQAYAGTIRRRQAAGGLLLAGATIWLSDSATVSVALVFSALGVGLVWLGRHVGRRWRWAMYAAVGLSFTVGGMLVVAFNDIIFQLMDRSSDMSGRGLIWRAVIEFTAHGSSLTGHGWVGYWPPWVPEFAHLAVFEGTPYHQAHNAFLDVWMQTGFIGLVLFAGLVFTTLVRTWWLALESPIGTHTAPFLILIALVVQAMTESRLLIEGNWLLLCYFAIAAKFRIQDVSVLPRHTLSTHTGPITAILDAVPDTPARGTPRQGRPGSGTPGAQANDGANAST